MQQQNTSVYLDGSYRRLNHITNSAALSNRNGRDDSICGCDVRQSWWTVTYAFHFLDWLLDKCLVLDLDNLVRAQRLDVIKVGVVHLTIAVDGDVVLPEEHGTLKSFWWTEVIVWEKKKITENDALIILTSQGEEAASTKECKECPSGALCSDRPRRDCGYMGGDGDKQNGIRNWI